ncbi:MAG: hypothetical protein WBS15_15010, partial [Mycobacterium sp.]
AGTDGNSGVIVRRLADVCWKRRRLLQPLPQPEKRANHYPDGQKNQYHHNRGAHTSMVTGRRSV